MEVFVDDGFSGLSTNRREGFNRMVDACLNGDIDLVLTKSISRFARNTVDTVTIIRKLKEKGSAFTLRRRTSSHWIPRANFC